MIGKKLKAELAEAIRKNDKEELRRIGERASNLAEECEGKEAAQLVAIALDAARAARGAEGQWLVKY